MSDGYTKQLLKLEEAGSALTDPLHFDLTVTDSVISDVQKSGDVDAHRLLVLAANLKKAQQDLADVLVEIKAKYVAQ